jgi:DNA adenine methylase
LWRVNSDGRMNVGWGKQKSIAFDVENIQAWQEALRGVDLRCESALSSTAVVQPGDLVYADPPYDETFTAYTAAGFTTFNQLDILRALRAWAANGAHVVCSNSVAIETLLAAAWPEAVRERVQTRDSVNCDGEGRGLRDELLFYVVHERRLGALANDELERIARALERLGE